MAMAIQGHRRKHGGFASFRVAPHPTVEGMSANGFGARGRSVAPGVAINSIGEAWHR